MKSSHLFLLAVLAWSGLFWWPVALRDQGILSAAVPDVFIPVGGLGLLLVTVVFAYRHGGWLRVRELLASNVRFNVGLRSWLPATVPAVLLVAAMSTYALMVSSMQVATFRVTLSPLILGIVVLAWVEEFVWRGFALPQLLETESPIRASCWLGLTWLPFHLPFFLMDGYDAWGAVGWFAWAPWYFLYPFFLTWLSIRSRFSVPVATLSHFLVNWVITWYEPASMENIGAIGGSLLLLAILLVGGRRAGVMGQG